VGFLGRTRVSSLPSGYHRETFSTLTGITVALFRFVAVRDDAKSPDNV
jgi:hypothetical protein